MSDVLEIHEFFVEGSSQERSHVLLHITEPSTPEEKERGYFFALAEISNGSLEQIEHLQQMIDDLESGYYETDEEEGDAFETTLEYINRRGHHVLQYKNSITNCIVGVLRGHEVSFAHHGTLDATLFYYTKGKFAELDILNEQEPDLSNDHLFSSILQGTISPGDFFYTATPHVSEYFDTDRVKKILTTRSTKQSAAHMQKVLKDMNEDRSFGGMVFHFPSTEKLLKTGKRPLTLEEQKSDSISRLVDQEKATAEVLSPPILGNVRKKMNSIKDQKKKKQDKKKLEKIQNKRKSQLRSKKRGAVETNFRPREEQRTESLPSSILASFGKILVICAVNLWNLIKKTTLLLVRSITLLILLITNKDNKRADVKKATRKAITDKKEQFEELPLLSKILFMATIVLAIIFIGSISVYKMNRGMEASKQVYQNQIQAVLDKKNAADASVIYGDDARALVLLQEAKKIITELPDRGKKQKNKILELTNEVDSTLMKLRKLNTLTPELLVDLSQTNEGAKTTGLALIDDTLMAFGPDDEALYLINLNNNSVEQKEHSTIPHLKTASTPKEQDFVLFTSNHKSISEYNKETESLVQKEISFPNEDTEISAHFVYNRRVYTIDSKNNQIYKHNPTQTGYDKGVEWIKDNEVDIKEAVSLAIDGDLFVLKQTGELIKLEGGQKQEFNTTGLDPELDNPSIIWTYNNLDNIYILEPTNKRVVVLDKEGKLEQQYTASEWQNPTGMIVKELEGIIYILDSNIIYKFNLL